MTIPTSDSGNDSYVPEEYEVPDDLKSRAKVILLLLISAPYIGFIGWCMYLMTVLPSVSGQHDYLIPIGSLTSLIGASVFVVLAGLAINRIIKNNIVIPMVKYIAMAKAVAVFLPGIIVGFMTPVVIKAEPPLTMHVIEPDLIENPELTAPLSITFSVEEAIEILSRRNIRPITYGWDYDGDGQKNEDTVLPTVTAVYDRAGSYNVVVRIQLNDGTFRRLVRRLVIAKETFEVRPLRPVVDEPIIFSVDHLVDDPEQLTEIQWDFDSDGTVDEVTNELEVSNVFLRLGPVKVTALVLYANNSQQRYERMIEIFKPLPLPFDVEIVTEPDNLISPPPFGTFFSVKTDEPLRDVKWNFGYNADEQVGFRVGHTFRSVGNYRVSAVARSESGDIARLNKLVRVVQPLSIPDLAFNGTPEVNLSRNVIEGEVPLSLNLTPITSQPLIEFFWEAPDATEVGETQTTLQAIYRRPGRYSVTLIGQDPEGRALRRPLIVNVLPPSSLVSLRMRPNDGGVAPLRVQFDASETVIPDEEITGFSWLYGNEVEPNPKPGSAVTEYVYTKPGTYTVTVFAQTTSGNRYEASKTIVVRPPLVDSCFRVSRDKGRAPLGVKFDASCSTGNNLDIEWDFDDGSQSDEKDPIHVFEEPGVYTVILTVSDDIGSEDTYSLEITAQ